MKSLALILSFLFSTSVFAATPVVQIGLTPEDTAPLFGVGESIKVNFTIDNTGSTTGYIPIYRMVIPQQLVYAGIDDCGSLGTPVVTNNSTGIDPFTGETVSLSAGEKLFVIEPPIAQLSPTQPKLDCNITFNLTASAAVGVAFQIREAKGLFVIGNNPSGTPGLCSGGSDTICSAASSSTIIPQLVKVTKEISDPKVSGPTRPVTTNINVDLASGSTLTNVYLTETISEFVQIGVFAVTCGDFTINPAPDACLFTPDPTTATGGTLELSYSSLSTDVSVSYGSFVRELKDDGSRIVPLTGGQTSDTNNASLIATEIPLSIDRPATVHARSHYVEKSVSNIGDAAPAGVSPGDTLRYTTTMYVSDYFSVNVPQLDFELSDGQTYDDGEFTLAVIEGGSTQTADESDLEPTYLDIGAMDGMTGKTAFDLALADAMANLPAFTDDVVDGAGQSGFVTTSRITLTHQATIETSYTAGGNEINAADFVSSSLLSSSAIHIMSGVGNTAVSTSATAHIVRIPALNLNVTHINGMAPGAAPIQVQNGDEVTFKMAFTIPAGGAENLKIVNYLPGPMLLPPGGGACLSSGGGIPAANDSWEFGTNDIGLTTGDVTINCNVTNGSIEFSFGDLTTAAPDQTTEIYFTVKANNNPMIDALKIIDSGYLSYENSFGTGISLANKAEVLDIKAPNVEPEIYATGADDPDHVIAGSNISAVDAGAVIDYSVDLTNEGRVTANNTTVTIAWPSYLNNPAKLSSCSEASCDYDIDFSDGDCGGTPVITGTDENGITVSGVNIAPIASAPANVCTITFKLLVDQTARASQTLQVSSSVTWSVGGGTFPPKTDTSTVTTADPALVFTFDATDDAQPSPGAPGQTVDWKFDATIPEGTITDAKFQTVEPGSGGNNWATFTPSATSVYVAAIFTQTVNTVPYFCLYPTSNTLDDNICFTKNPVLAANQSDNGSTTFTVDFGTIVNGFNDADDEHIEFIVRNGVINSGASLGVRQIRGRMSRDNPAGGADLTTPITANRNYTVVKPQLSLQMCAAPTPTNLSLADTVTYRVVVRNTGSNSSKAFDVESVGLSFPTGVDFDSGNFGFQAFSCNSIPASCAAFTSAGCSDVTSVSTASGNNLVSIGVADGGGNPDIGAEQSFVFEMTMDVNCASASDSSGVDHGGASHPDDDGVASGCSKPVLSFANNLDIRTEVIDYATLDGGSIIYTSAQSNLVSIPLDLDGDGINNSVEGSSDSDGDGVNDYLDTDSDDNGISDTTEGSGLADNNNNGTPDYQDQDDDGDGINDAVEINLGSGSTDSDGDGIMDFRDADSDNDGIADGSEDLVTAQTNTDGVADGANYLDLDSDNDGIPDFIENGLSTCDAGAGGGIASNGILEPGEVAACNVPTVCVGNPCDADDNGAIELSELVGGELPDQDEDGVPNAFDLDSDNDGLADSYEAFYGPTSANGLTFLEIELALGSDQRISADTVPGYGTGNEFTAIAALFGDHDELVEFAELINTDGDAWPNYLDTDSDDDGIFDLIESNRYTYDDTDVSVTGNDDGEIDYASETGGADFINRTLLPIPDTDNDGLADFIDIDADGDGVADWIEAFGTVTITEATDFDVNDNGRLESNESPAVILALGNNDSVLDYDSELQDTDNDNIPDFRDLDSNADNISDAHASDDDGDPATVISRWIDISQDIDSDSKLDYLDDDTDGDTITNIGEAGDVVLLTIPIDTDSDGTPNYKDTDSDDDGLSDANEIILGSSSINSDTDNDGCYDGCEATGVDGINLTNSTTRTCPYPLTSWWNVPANPSPVTSPTNADTDGGGIGDCKEASPPPGRPVLDPRVGHGSDDSWYDDDPDNDGLTNDEEVDLGTDYNDPDSDNDGLKDGPELATHNTDPLDDDSDNDNLKDGDEVITYRTNPLDIDTDDDGLQDDVELLVTHTKPLDPDSDDDGLTDGQEQTTYHTDPNNPDTDGGGIPDGEEVALHLDPLDDKDDDLDDDGIPNLSEIDMGLDPTKDDTNNDCLSDAVEVGSITNPRDSDGDGVIDALDADNDGDGISDCEEIRLGTNPMSGQDTMIQGSGTGCGVIAHNHHKNGNPFVFLILMLPVLFVGFGLLKKLFLKFAVRILALFLLCGVFSQSSEAINIQHFWPAAGASNLITSRHFSEAPVCDINLVYNFLRNGLEFGKTSNNEHLDTILKNLHTGNFGVHCSFTDYFSAYGIGSYNIATVFEDINSEKSTNHSNFGDTIVGLNWKIKEWKNNGRNFSISFNPESLLATGADKILIGNSKAIYNANFVFNYDWQQQYEANLSLGYQYREEEELLNLEVRPSLLAKLGLSARISEMHNLYVNGEAFYMHPLTDTDVDHDVTTPFEIYGGLKQKFGSEKQWSWMAGGGMGLTNGYGAGDWRAYSGINYTFIRQQPRLIDNGDIEIMISGDLDLLPRLTYKLRNRAMGSTVSGVVTPAISKSNLTPGMYELEISEKNTVMTQASLEIKAKQVVKKRFKVSLDAGQPVKLDVDPIFFVTAKAEIQPKSFPTLDQLAAELQGDPNSTVAIHGHTDSVGKDDYNMNLSANRAKSVLEYLAQKGVAKNRLSSQGFGETKPIASNDTAEGKSKNRRVEFLKTQTVVKKDAIIFSSEPIDGKSEAYENLK